MYVTFQHQKGMIFNNFSRGGGGTGSGGVKLKGKNKHRLLFNVQWTRSLYQHKTQIIKSQIKSDLLFALHVTLGLKRTGGNEVERTEQAQITKAESRGRQSK